MNQWQKDQKDLDIRYFLENAAKINGQIDIVVIDSCIQTLGVTFYNVEQILAALVEDNIISPDGDIYKIKKHCDANLLEQSTNYNMAISEMIVTTGYYFDENGTVKDIANLAVGHTAHLALEEFPKVFIVSGGLVIGEYCYYADELEIKLIQAGFILKTYEEQKGDYFYVKKVKSNHVEAEDGDFDLIEYVSTLCKNQRSAGMLLISYLLDDAGSGLDWAFDIAINGIFGKETLKRAGVKI